MNLSDIIALAKSGYSVADVKELMSLDAKTTEPTPTENVQAEEPPTKVDVENATVDDGKNEVHNYKELYEDLATKYADLEKQVTHMQELNTRQPSSAESEDFATTFEDIARNFM